MSHQTLLGDQLVERINNMSNEQRTELLKRIAMDLLTESQLEDVHAELQHEDEVDGFEQSSTYGRSQNI